jgi:hypothetical protein
MTVLGRFRTVIERLGTLKDAEGTLGALERLGTPGAVIERIGTVMKWT